MRTTRTISAVAAVATLAAGSVLISGPAEARAGTTPLTEVLAADGNTYDRNWDDFDIAEKAVRAVLKANPDSTVAVLADGDTALTAFVPTDRAFRKFVKSVTGDRPSAEKATFAAVASLGADTVENVLLYHVVPGATVTYAAGRKSDGARLETALGKHIGVRVAGGEVRIVDADRDARNARVIPAAKNLNKGNEQIAHGLDRVLRPMDL
jgi:uncharacterized surface protein with fasciclin (FAS1) repeats